MAPYSIQESEIQKTDVLIVGSGSAGLAAATWLARYKIPFTVLESRSGPLNTGQADGVQCRTVEIMEAFGVSEDLLKEAYHVLEDAFWAKRVENGDDLLRRERVVVDTEVGLSHLPHVILNQARLNGLLIGEMGRLGGRGIKYGYKVQGVEVDRTRTGDPEAHCVTVRAEKDGREEMFRAKFVLGCDGAHSVVRRSLGFSMVGDSTDTVWGVMDVFPRTSFPDIRRKAALRTPQGSALIIPREGEAMVRFYVELPAGTAASSVKLEHLQEQIRRIFAPRYNIEFAATAWWSAYVIGQRLANSFHCDYRVFLTGDACHTHSPKAGQGMNVSLQDGFNIGWKLGAVLSGQCPHSLLETYVLERQAVAAELIDFDRHWSKIFSSKTPEENPAYFSNQWVKFGRYTAGLMISYGPSAITNPPDETAQKFARNLQVGSRMPSRQVVRFCDGKALQLAKSLPADGRWRVLIFPGDIRARSASDKLAKLSEYLSGVLVPQITARGDDVDSVIEPILVLSGIRVEMEQEQIPDYFWPAIGKFRMRDLHKTYVDEESWHSGHGRVYETFGVDPEIGATVLVRPDQHIAMICGVGAFEELGKFFSGFMLPKKQALGNSML